MRNAATVSNLFIVFFRVPIDSFSIDKSALRQELNKLRSSVNDFAYENARLTAENTRLEQQVSKYVYLMLDVTRTIWIHGLFPNPSSFCFCGCY